jgi:hypothetical protein
MKTEKQRGNKRTDASRQLMSRSVVFNLRCAYTRGYEKTSYRVREDVLPVM